MNLEVQLKPQTIVEKTAIGSFLTKIGQSQVFANGKVVGHICDPPEAPLNFCERLPEAVRQQIRDRVAQLRGLSTTTEGGSPPDPDTVRAMIAELNPPDDDEYDELDEDEDGLDAIG